MKKYELTRLLCKSTRRVMANTTLQDELNVLRRRLAREKQAREAAESLLDDYAKNRFLLTKIFVKRLKMPARNKKKLNSSLSLPRNYRKLKVVSR